MSETKVETGKLNACPFCGGKAARRFEYGNWAVRCKKCGANVGGNYADTPDSVVAAWNRRAGDQFRDVTKMVGNVARLREALQTINNEALRSIWEGHWQGSITASENFKAFLDWLTVGDDAPCSALSAPPRNCDRFATEEDANAAFDEMCAQRGSGIHACIGCKYNAGERGGFPSISHCRVAWLFDTAGQDAGGVG